MRNAERLVVERKSLALHLGAEQGEAAVRLLRVLPFSVFATDPIATVQTTTQCRDPLFQCLCAEIRAEPLRIPIGHHPDKALLRRWLCAGRIEEQHECFIIPEQGW